MTRPLLLTETLRGAAPLCCGLLIPVVAPGACHLSQRPEVTRCVPSCHLSASYLCPAAWSVCVSVSTRVGVACLTWSHVASMCLAWETDLRCCHCRGRSVGNNLVFHWRHPVGWYFATMFERRRLIWAVYTRSPWLWSWLTCPAYVVDLFVCSSFSRN